MLVHQDKWLADQVADVPSIIFLTISYRLRALKSLYFYLWFIKNTKNKLKWFFKEFCKKLQKLNNTWNIRLLVDKSFVPANLQTSILYGRLSDPNIKLSRRIFTNHRSIGMSMAYTKKLVHHICNTACTVDFLALNVSHILRNIESGLVSCIWGEKKLSWCILL